MEVTAGAAADTEAIVVTPVMEARVPDQRDLVLKAQDQRDLALKALVLILALIVY